jgi:hypothetical protein
MLLRIVNSPFGRVLQAIRENDFRAEAIGYKVVLYRTAGDLSFCGGRGAGRQPVCDLAAICGARHDAVFRDHARHSADGGDRRYGHDVWRGDRRHPFGACAELPSER